jgi:hypothetical protein
LTSIYYSHLVEVVEGHSFAAVDLEGSKPYTKLVLEQQLQDRSIVTHRLRRPAISSLLWVASMWWTLLRIAVRRWRTVVRLIRHREDLKENGQTAAQFSSGVGNILIAPI